MPYVALNLFGEDAPPLFRVLQLDNGGVFISIQLGPDVSVILPGLDRECAAYGRTLADTLREGADACEDRFLGAATPVAEEARG